MNTNKLKKEGYIPIKNTIWIIDFSINYCCWFPTKRQWKCRAGHKDGALEYKLTKNKNKYPVWVLFDLCNSHKTLEGKMYCWIYDNYKDAKNKKKLHDRKDYKYAELSHPKKYYKEEEKWQKEKQ